MWRIRRFGSIALALGAVGFLVAGANRGVEPGVAAQVTATPYHEGFPSPVASPGATVQALYPLPAPQDLDTADMMASGGAAMIQAAEGMAEAAQMMRASDVPGAVDRSQHWAEDARALRERGAWMVLASTSESMVHDPDRARELNLQSLRGNGLSMAAEGQAMAEHGQEMAAEVDQRRQDGTVSEAAATELAADARALTDAGVALQRDGERMQEYAETLLQSIGQ